MTGLRFTPRVWGQPPAPPAREVRDSEVRGAFEAERLRREAAQALAKLRKKAGLTQAQLASKAGVPQSVVGRVESATEERSLTLATVARVFSPLGRVHISVRPAAAKRVGHVASKATSTARR